MRWTGHKVTSASTGGRPGRGARSSRRPERWPGRRRPYLTDGPSAPHPGPGPQRRALGRGPARATVRGVVRLQLLANGLGVAAVAAYFLFLFPLRAQVELAPVDLNVAAFTTYVAAMIVLALPLNTLAIAGPWCGSPRAPSRPTANASCSSVFPVETFSALLSWFGAAVLFGVINSTCSASRSASRSPGWSPAPCSTAARRALPSRLRPRTAGRRAPRGPP